MTKILIATHKEYNFPSDPLYTPIQVGKDISKININILGDNTGINISKKNKNYCELTAIYWAWKNQFYSNIDYIGLVHYRRYFKGKTPFLNYKILSENEIDKLLVNYDVILPKKRNYYIETIYTHYANAHYSKDLDMTRKIIEIKYPRYLNEFDILMKGSKASMFNMFVMKKEHFMLYCEWLFDILETLEEEIDISNYSLFQQRVFGFIAELLLNVWVNTQKLKIKELEVVHIEGENLIYKGFKMFMRKYLSHLQI